jgi:nitrite reductase/ring-hydroxylating ferredoxin subunit
MKQFKYPIHIFFIFIALMYLPVTSCDNNDDEYIPYVPILLDIDLGLINSLKVSGYSMKFPEFGYSGVIVLCQFYDNFAPANSIFQAFDATCTNEITRDCSLEVDDNSIIATCPCCGSKFSLFDGYPIEGVAKRPLRSYKTYLYNENLRVKN